MPVISENARAMTLASYSWVVIVSETTLISMPRNGSAARMKNSISAICSSIDRDDGVNSSSIQRRAAAIRSSSVWARTWGAAKPTPPRAPATPTLFISARRPTINGLLRKALFLFMDHSPIRVIVSAGRSADGLAA